MDPENGDRWRELMSNKGVGLILQGIQTRFKVVSAVHF